MTDFDPHNSDIGVMSARLATTEQRLIKLEENQIVTGRKIDENTRLTMTVHENMTANRQLLLDIAAVLETARFAFKVLTFIGVAGKWMLSVAGGFGVLSAGYLWVMAHWRK